LRRRRRREVGLGGVTSGRGETGARTCRAAHGLAGRTDSAGGRRPAAGDPSWGVGRLLVSLRLVQCERAAAWPVRAFAVLGRAVLEQ
jgi:hypothetical protein